MVGSLITAVHLAYRPRTLWASASMRVSTTLTTQRSMQKVTASPEDPVATCTQVATEMSWCTDMHAVHPAGNSEIVMGEAIKVLASVLQAHFVHSIPCAAGLWPEDLCAITHRSSNGSGLTSCSGPRSSGAAKVDAKTARSRALRQDVGNLIGVLV